MRYDGWDGTLPGVGAVEPAAEISAGALVLALGRYFAIPALGFVIGVAARRRRWRDGIGRSEELLFAYAVAVGIGIVLTATLSAGAGLLLTPSGMVVGYLLGDPRPTADGAAP